MAAISGTYRGFVTAPASGGKHRLDLRVDVDSRIDDGPVLQRVSGDFFRVEQTALPGKPPTETEIYEESWIVEQPQVAANADTVIITGTICYWNGMHPKTDVTIRIPLAENAPADVTLLRQSLQPMTYSCAPAAKFFRTLRLEVDVCKSVSEGPILPAFQTHALDERPPGITSRLLTLDRAWSEAGVDVLIAAKDRQPIDDSAIQFWTDAELHNAMEKHFTAYSGSWPRWEMWGLLASLYTDDLVGGVMFDYAAAHGGPKDAPERQGFAVFRKHFWFDKLVADPQTPEQLTAARKFLWTFTHEAGHAFNLQHSAEKNRASALSWMNYDWQYDNVHGKGAYWKSFPFRFDDEELIHIRHGNRPSVIMGGDPWPSGAGRAEAPPGAEQSHVPPAAFVTVTGEVPLELLIRAQPYHEFLEPVSVEVRVRNLLPVPFSINSTLHPEFGNVSLFIRRPDGRLLQYMPITCKIAEERIKELAPAGAQDGSDRHSRTIFASYGRYGFYFDEPGQYFVRAVYHGPGNMLIPSNVLRLRVGHPKTEDADRLAQDYFSYESGASLYLGGSQSQFLASGMDVLRGMIESQKDSLAAAKTAARIARGIGLPFHDVVGVEKPLVRRATAGDAEAALGLTRLALDIFGAHAMPELNIAIERAVRTRADMHIIRGDPELAYKEMMKLAADLRKNRVKESVVAGIETEAESIEGGMPKKRKPPAKKKPEAKKKPPAKGPKKAASKKRRPR
jgi:hypothetical protein